MPFGLKNTCATYQRLMDNVLSNQIRNTLEVYSDEMVVKTPEEGDHCSDLEKILKPI